jgi:hypothetical protein
MVIAAGKQRTGWTGAEAFAGTVTYGFITPPAALHLESSRQPHRQIGKPGTQQF